MNKKELCIKYNISYPTLRNWLKIAKIDTGRRRFLFPQEIKKFIEHFGAFY